MAVLEAAIILGVPALLIGGLVLPSLRAGINLADEGYLVLGTRLLLAGKVPIRDFRAYDPGRYTWCAPFALVAGRGYIATRIAMAVAAFLALVVLSALVLGATGAPALTAAAALLSLIWLQPRHKQIENLFCLLSVFLLYNATVHETRQDFLLLGLALGLASFFGLNIFVYMLGSTLILAGFAAFGAIWTEAAAPALWIGVGMACGALPVLLQVSLARGYLGAYLDRKVWTILRRRSANLRLPLPWLWSSASPAFDQKPPVERIALKTLFTATPLLFVAVILLAPRAEAFGAPGALTLAFVGSCVGLVTYHHTLSRADLGHLFLVTQVTITVIAALLSLAVPGPVAALLLLLLAALSVPIAWTELHHPPAFWRQRTALVPFVAGGDRFLLLPGMAHQLTRLREIVDAESAPGDAILAVPVQAGLYAIFDRRPAAYDTFPVYPSTAGQREATQGEVARADPPLLLIGTKMTDARPDLGFLTNYPEIAKTIAERYDARERIAQIDVFVRRKGPSQAG